MTTSTPNDWAMAGSVTVARQAMPMRVRWAKTASPPISTITPAMTMISACFKLMLARSTEAVSGGVV